jgi:hypothetical protein
MLRILYCLDSRLTDGCKVVRLTHRPRSTRQKYYSSASGSNFCYRMSKPQGLVHLEGLGKFKKKKLHAKKFIHLIGSRTGDLPACRIVPQQLHYRLPSLDECIIVLKRKTSQSPSLSLRSSDTIWYFYVRSVDLVSSAWKFSLFRISRNFLINRVMRPKPTNLADFHICC